MYTREQFGRELKERVLRRQDTIEIGRWAFSTYWEHIEDIDLDFREILLTLNKMELGSEFSFTYEKLNEISDNLISGEEVNLNY
jgi:hypothetical protein